MENEKIRCGSCLYRASDLVPWRCDYVAIVGHTRLAQPPEKCKYYVPAKGNRPCRKAAEEAAGVKRTYDYLK